MGSQPFLIDEGTMLAVQILNAELPVSIQQRCMPPGHKDIIKRDIRIKMLALAAKHRYGFGQSYNVPTLVGIPRSTIKRRICPSCSLPFLYAAHCVYQFTIMQLL